MTRHDERLSMKNEEINKKSNLFLLPSNREEMLTLYEKKIM